MGRFRCFFTNMIDLEYVSEIALVLQTLERKRQENGDKNVVLLDCPKDIPQLHYSAVENALDIISNQTSKIQFQNHRFLNTPSSSVNHNEPDYAEVDYAFDVRFLGDFGNFVRNYLRKNPNKKELPQEKPTEYIRVTGLFRISKHPPSVCYDGKSINNVQESWYRYKTKTQQFAILWEIAQKYQRNKNKGNEYNEIKISYDEVKRILDNPSLCDRRIKWIEMQPRRNLYYLKNNIRKLFPFSDENMFVVSKNNFHYLIFKLPS